VEENDISKAAFSKIRPKLSSNYYSILSNIAPPPCQVEEQEYANNVNDLTALKKFIKKGVLKGSIPSIVMDSTTTSSVCTPTAPLIPTGRISNKIFQLPVRMQTVATTVSELAHNVRQPAKDVHIVPSIKSNSLLSMENFVKAGYITVIDNKEVNIYDTQDTTFKVSRAAILRGWFDKTANLWQIPLISCVLNSNTDTVLVNKPPTEFLPDCPPAIKAIHNVYELKTQPELVWYLHTCAGFPTKPSWIKAIKNRQYASWPGLTIKAAAKYFPESKETMKGHGRKTKSGLRSTKTPAKSDNDNNKKFKAQIYKNNMTFQLVPPHDHQRNIAEKTIQTFKRHFISILCGTDKDFPLHLWCCLLPQAKHTLNMLRRARVTLLGFI
jgi:hypothetical protein